MQTSKKEVAIWSFYPRPQLKRKKYMILNEGWKLNGQPITVPFPPQSDLSEYRGEISTELTYLCTFTLPSDFTQPRILLHFGAVDQRCDVYVNDTFVGHNEGGYLPFSLDVTKAVNRNSENVLKVVALDDLCHDYPYGKQTNNPGGMWYTPVSGIWQNVWIENVPETYVTKLKIDVDLEQVELHLEYNQPVKATETFEVNVELPDGSSMTQAFTEGKAIFPVPNPIHWTPENPYLYNMTITAGEDSFESYFALRTIGTQNINGVNRICLNHKPIFLHGVLDQGYFKDGIFLPTQESGYDNDIQNMKDLGFNMLRKHIKIEPDYFYYACDKLGMLVMQDMVNSGEYSFLRDTVLPTIGLKRKKDAHLSRDNRRRQIFEEQTRLTIEHLYNHPCVIAYTIFNEGWGQFDSDEMYDYVKALDKTRLVDSTSGWFAQSKNDFDSEHIYFRLKKLKVKKRPLFISECGGYQLLDKEHFFGNKEYGYGTCKDSADLTNRIVQMYEKMILPGIKDGVCGCVYTQVSDVEDEINGLFTYDREVCKVEKAKLLEIARKITTALNDL